MMAKLLTLVPPNDGILRRPCGVVTVKDLESRKLQDLIDDMIHTCSMVGGVGLAAPQVGVDKQLAVVVCEGTTLVMCNPAVEKEKGPYFVEEGCLSFPGDLYIAQRSQDVKVNFTGRQGEYVTVSARGYLAEVISHEVDHLHGLTLTRFKKKNTDPAAGILAAMSNG